MQLSEIELRRHVGVREPVLNLRMAEDLKAKLHEALTQRSDQAREDVRRYFSTEGGGFTGSQFELVADMERPNEVTASDVVALTMLSIDVRAIARPVRWLLSPEGTEQVSALLREVPVDVDIWDPDAERLLAPEGDLWRLWDLLGTASWPQPREANGLGRTTRSKLLAAKRPRLVPVYDSVVAEVLPTDHIWRDFRELLVDGEVRAQLEEVTADAPAHVSLLRRLDVVVWMYGRHS